VRGSFLRASVGRRKARDLRRTLTPATGLRAGAQRSSAWLAVAGKAAGTALFGKASERAFRAAALGTVLLIAGLGVATALRALI